MKHKFQTGQRIFEITLLAVALLCTTNAIIMRSESEAERDDVFHRTGLANKQRACFNDYVKYSRHTALDRIEEQLCAMRAAQ